MKTCKTCQHWQDLKPAGYYDEDSENYYHDKEVSVEDAAWGVCQAIKHEQYKAVAFTQDGESYASNLVSTSEFGCNQHKEVIT